MKLYRWLLMTTEELITDVGWWIHRRIVNDLRRRGIR